MLGSKLVDSGHDNKIRVNDGLHQADQKVELAPLNLVGLYNVTLKDKHFFFFEKLDELQETLPIEFLFLREELMLKDL